MTWWKVEELELQPHEHQLWHNSPQRHCSAQYDAGKDFSTFRDIFAFQELWKMWLLWHPRPPNWVRQRRPYLGHHGPCFGGPARTITRPVNSWYNMANVFVITVFTVYENINIEMLLLWSYFFMWYLFIFSVKSNWIRDIFWPLFKPFFMELLKLMCKNILHSTVKRSMMIEQFKWIKLKWLNIKYEKKIKNGLISSYLFTKFGRASVCELSVARHSHLEY